MNLLGLLAALIVVGVILWGINRILGVTSIPEPFKTIIWVVVVVIAILTIVQMSGLYSFTSSVRLR